jgi:hypothetical protein
MENKLTAEQKAQELIEKYRKLYVTVKGCSNDGNPCIVTNNMYSNAAIRCALIAVGEIDKAIDFDWMEVQNLDREHAYWESVKQHLLTL